MNFESRIKELCLKSNMSLQQLAENSGVSVSTIRKMIRSGGNIRINTIWKLCKALSIGLSDFFCDL